MQCSRGRAAPTLVIIAIGVVFWTAIGSNVLRTALRTDFLNLYTGSTLARTGQFQFLYNSEHQTAIQDRLMPGEAAHFPFVRPPFYALALAPLSMLPVRAAFAVWLGFQVAALLVVWAWAWCRYGPPAVAYCAFFLPAIMGIANGQDCILPVLILLAAWLLMEKGRDGLAGLVLSLTLFKFHLFLLLPAAILLRRRWRLLGGYASGGLALAGVSFLLAGVSGLRSYMELLTRKDIEGLSPSPEMMIGLNAIAVNLGTDAIWLKALLFSAVIALAGWSAWRAGSDLRWFWTAVGGSMLLSPHTYEYDVSSLLIPGIIAVSTAGDRVLRFVAAAALLPASYFLTAAGTPWAVAPSLVVVVFVIALSGVLPHPALSEVPGNSGVVRAGSLIY